MTRKTINFQGQEISEGDVVLVQLGAGHMWYKDFASTKGLINLPVYNIDNVPSLGGCLRDDDDYNAFVAVGDADLGCPDRYAGKVISVTKPTTKE